MYYIYLLLCVAVGAFWLFLVFKLHWMSMLVIAAFMSGMIIVHRRMRAKEKECALRLDETVLYIESMLQAFSREGKIDASLSDVVAALKPGVLKEVLENAYNHIQITFDESDVMENALYIIEESYRCKRVCALHRLLLHAELFGGDSHEAISLMLEDCRRWQLRMKEAIEERKKAFREILLSVIASVVICGCILHLPIMGVDVSGNPIVQVLSVLLVVIDDLIILWGQKYLCVDWINLDGFDHEYESKQKLRRYRAYDEKKERALSYVLSAVGFIPVCLCFFFKWYWVGAIGMSIELVLINQHTIGHKINGRSIKKEIKSAFPSWLIDLALLMQSENVYNAIQKSRAQAPGILADDLRQLENELTIDPESSRPYHNFLKEFELPQVTSAMGMIYSLSMGNSSGGKSELLELVNGNYKSLDDAEKVRLKDKASGMYLLFLAPVLTASLKLVIDMAVFMISFVGQGIKM